MKFTRYNNPRKKKRKTRKPPYSESYINERKEELYQLLSEANSDYERDMLIKAFNVSIRP